MEKNRKMSGNKCAYFNCGVNRRMNKTVRMFRFPKKEDICKEWIMNCGNPSLLCLPPDMLNNKYMCEKHFKDDDYRTEKRHFLKQNAVPIKCSTHFEMQNNECSGDSSKVLAPPEAYLDKKRPPSPSYSPEVDSSRKKMCFESEHKNISFLNEVSELPDSLETPRKQRMKTRIKLQALKIKSYRSKLKQLGAKYRSSKNISLSLVPFLSVLTTIAKIFVLMQLKGRRRTFNKNEKEFAIALFYKSPSAYIFLRRKGIILPSPTIVRRWISENMFKTGFDDNLKKHLNIKCDAMTSQEKKCVLAFDEMSIKECLEYNKKLDIIEGFEDLGPFGRTNRKATNATVFSIRGLYSNWKIPVSYFFSANSLRKEYLKDLILFTINALFEIGFIPKVIVADQGSNNRDAFSLLGATKDKPFFFCGNKKLIAIFDVPHLFKSIRNNMLSGVFELCDKIIDFDIIRKTYEIDTNSNTARALPKITDKHINPNAFEKMSCKLALQIFSNAMSTAIKTCVSLGKIDQNIGTDTADFVLTLNNLFDALNSKRVYSKNPYNCGMNEKNTFLMDILNKGKDIFQSIQKITKNKEQTVKSRSPCFDGMVQTINGVFELVNEEKPHQTFLLTGRLNQDFLQRGGWNVIQTAKSFRLSFRIQTITGLLKPSKVANCETDSDFSLIMSNDTLSNPAVVGNGISYTSECRIEFPHIDDTTLEDCAINYYCGYLLYKLQQIFHCNSCKNEFETTHVLSDQNQLFLLSKNYGCESKLFLVAPTREVEKIVYKSMIFFRKYFSVYKHEEYVFTKIKNKIFSHNRMWLGKKDSYCYEHKVFFISHLVKTSVYKFCKC